jgi:hypothetical protein
MNGAGAGGCVDPNYGAKILERQSARLIELQAANEELE